MLNNINDWVMSNWWISEEIKMPVLTVHFKRAFVLSDWKFDWFLKVFKKLFLYFHFLQNLQEPTQLGHSYNFFYYSKNDTLCLAKALQGVSFLGDMYMWSRSLSNCDWFITLCYLIYSKRYHAIKKENKLHIINW